MFPTTEPSLRVALMGLPTDSAESVEQIVSERGVVLCIPPQYPILPSLAFIRAAAPDLLFLWAGDHQGRSDLDAVRKAEPHLPIVAISYRLTNQEIRAALDSLLVNLYTPHSDLAEIQRLLQASDQAACC